MALGERILNASFGDEPVDHHAYVFLGEGRLMQVDPGTLLVFGRLGDVPIIGAQGCALGPRENGFDWLLSRLFPGENPTSLDISELGYWWSLMEIPTRPYPRDGADTNQSALPQG
jgi:molybdenum cofactor cytidylyltransferase